MVDGICKDCMFLSGSTYLTYENGSVADVGTGVYNHHVFVADMGKSMKNYFSCSWAGFPKSPQQPAAQNGAASPGGHAHGGGGAGMVRRQFGMSQIFGSGDDGSATQYATKNSANKVGFYIGPKDNIFQSSEFINYRNESQVIYITMDVEYIKGRPAGWRDGSLGTLNAAGCVGMMFYPPAGKVTELASQPYTATTNGSIYNAHAHLHDGGIESRLKVNGKLACTSKAIYGGEKGTTTVAGKEWATIQGYEFCDGPIDVKKGDQIVLESTYDLIKHQLRPGAMDHSMGADAMALLGFVFAPDA
jgi:hypothetical protein